MGTEAVSYSAHSQTMSDDMLDDGEDSSESTPSLLPIYKTTNHVKPVIPLVNTVTTDDQLNLIIQSKNVPMNLEKVYKLLTDPVSCHLYERHIFALRKIARHYTDGFIVRELILIFKILNVCADKLGVYPDYEQPMVTLIRLCGLSFLKEKSSDILVYHRIIVESISQLGYLMRVDSDLLKIEICRSLISFYLDESHFPTLSEYQPLDLSYKRELIHDSDIAETMVKSMCLMNEEEQLLEHVMYVIERFSKYSRTCCNQMLKSQAASKICYQLTKFDPAGRTFFMSINTMWNLLDNGDLQVGAAQLANIPCINQLRNAFLYQLTQSHSHYHRQLRNDIIAIVYLIVVSRQPCSAFMDMGFSRQICTFAMFQEVKTHSIYLNYLRLTTNYDDFELKKQLYALIIALSLDEASLPILSKANVIMGLFKFVRPNNSAETTNGWSPAQFEELQLLALSCLSSLCPLMLPDFLSIQGSTRLLLLLEFCVTLDDFGGTGNSFHGTGGYGNKRAQMRYCLRLIRSLLSVGDMVIIQDFVDQGLINQILVILHAAMQAPDKDDAVDVEIQMDMLVILSLVCENNLHNKELFGSLGVEIVIFYLRMDPSLLDGGLGHRKLLIAAIDIVWSCIIGCPLTEDEFFTNEGVYLLLDLTQVVPKAFKNQVLGCLIDLCDNQKTVSHLLVWRGEKGTHIANLLCEVWRQEENDQGIGRDKIGAITNIEAPLLTSTQEALGIFSLPADKPSAAVVDVFENMRAKIYSLFCTMGFRNWPHLPVEDFITLSVIERYIDLKLGEIWIEIDKELALENTRPTTPDAEGLEEIKRGVISRAQQLHGVQVELNETQKMSEIIDEQGKYCEIRHIHKQKEMVSEDFYNYVHRTSDHGYLKDCRQKMDMEVDVSRFLEQPKKGSHVHDVEVKDTDVTAFTGVKVHVDSTPVAITGGHLANYNKPKTKYSHITLRPVAEHDCSSKTI